MNLVRSYNRLLHTRPLLTNVLTTSTFMAIGDLISQPLLQDKPTDLEQTKRFAVAGLIYSGPAWYGSLVLVDHIFGPTKNLKVLGKKILFDQGIIGPIFLVGCITTFSLLEQCSIKHVSEQLKENYVKVLLAEYTYWPFVQLVNYYYVPLTYRALVGSTATLVWNTIFSYLIYYKKHKLTEDK